MLNRYPKIIIMRHSETVWNAPRKRLQGCSLNPAIVLSENGKSQARLQLAALPKPDVLITSPLIRCIQTAEAWFGTDYANIPCKKIIINNLREVDVGEMEGLYADDIDPKYKTLWNAWKNSPLTFTGFPNGETIQQFQSRVLSAFSKICQDANADTAVIAHGGPIRILKCFLENKDLSHLWDGNEVSNLDRLELTEEQIIKLRHYQQQVSKISMFKTEYSATHWAHHEPTANDKNFIAELEINGVRLALKLNPTDARGYRSLVSLLPEVGKPMSSTFNREYTLDEELALSQGLALLAAAYKKFGMATQISIAGNNSQSLSGDGNLIIGNDKEPAILHGHVLGRGNPMYCYISDVPLLGPKAGLEFNLRGDGVDPGNDRKVKWTEAAMEAITKGLASQLQPHDNIKLISKRVTYCV